MDEFELRYADYTLSGDQEAVRDAFADFFGHECPLERVRAAEPWRRAGPRERARRAVAGTQRAPAGGQGRLHAGLR